MPAQVFKYRKPNATEYLIYTDFCHRHNVSLDMFPFHKKFTDEFGKCTGYAEVIRYTWLGSTILNVCAISIEVRFVPDNTIRTWVLFTDRTGKFDGNWTEQAPRDGKTWTLK